MHDILSGIDARFHLWLCQAKQWKDLQITVHTQKWVLGTSAQRYKWYVTTEKTKQYEKGRSTLQRWISRALWREVHHYRAHCKGPRSLKIRPQIYTLFCEHTCIQLHSLPQLAWEKRLCCCVVLAYNYNYILERKKYLYDWTGPTTLMRKENSLSYE